MTKGNTACISFYRCGQCTLLLSFENNINLVELYYRVTKVGGCGETIRPCPFNNLIPRVFEIEDVQ